MAKIVNVEDLNENIQNILSETHPNTKLPEKRCVWWTYQPENIGELLKIDGLSSLLCSGWVFFHNKKPISKELFDKIYSFFDIENTSNKNIQLNCKCDFYTGEDHKWLSCKNDKLYILSVETSGQNTKKIIEKLIHKKFCKNHGVWILGYVDEWQHLIPSFFDALFIFDTSDYEFDILKRRMTISDSSIKALRMQELNLSSNENVIFFLNYEKKPDFPLIDVNPKVLAMNGKVKNKVLFADKTFCIENYVEGDLIQGDKEMGDNYNLNNVNNTGGNIGNNNQIGGSPEEPSLFKKPLFYIGIAAFIYFCAVLYTAYDLQQKGMLGNKTFKEIVLSPIPLLKSDDKK